MLASIVVFGAIYVSPALIGACAGAGITLTLLERNGRFSARIEGPVSGNVLLRRAQYRISETPEDIVRSFLVGKVANQRAVLMRGLRDHGDELLAGGRDDLAAAIARLGRLLDRIARARATLDELRGAEGEAAASYFGVFDHLILTSDQGLRWRGRSRRPPLDAVNALLSFLYTLLTHDCRSALEAVGLDPAVGFLHRDRPGRPSLALDLMEELRPILVDRLVLSLINRRQLRSTDFETRENGSVMMSDDARKLVLTAWQERKREERLHLFLDEKAPLGLTPFLQAQMLARHLRGDLDAYPPWFWK
jgi:CRISPR-associated protein Cas1